MKVLVAISMLGLVAACAGGQAQTREAERQCRAQGGQSGSTGFEDCVHDRLDALYKSWGRDSLSRGD